MEVSYPSSTTLLVLCVMPTLAEQFNRRAKVLPLKKMMHLLTAVFSAFMITGRLVSGVHWLTDICSFLLIVLPLYPNTVGEYISSVNLPAYSESSPASRMLFWILFLALIMLGLAKVALAKLKPESNHKSITTLSLLFSIATVLILALSRIPYATAMAFLLLMIKGVLLLKCIKQM